MGRPRKDAPPSPGFLRQWDSFDDPIVNTHAPRWPQTCARLTAYFVKIFGGKPDDYVVGIFTDKDMPGRIGLGYHPFSIGDFPRIEQDGKTVDTMNDSIARGLGVQIDTEGSLRWGDRGELRVCMIRKDRWEQTVARPKEETNKRLMETHLKTGKTEATRPGQMESDVELFREQDHGPRRSPGDAPT